MMTVYEFVRAMMPPRERIRVATRDGRPLVANSWGEARRLYAREWNTGGLITLTDGEIRRRTDTHGSGNGRG